MQKLQTTSLIRELVLLCGTVRTNDFYVTVRGSDSLDVDADEMFVKLKSNFLCRQTATPCQSHVDSKAVERYDIYFLDVQ